MSRAAPWENDPVASGAAAAPWESDPVAAELNEDSADDKTGTDNPVDPQGGLGALETGAHYLSGVVAPFAGGLTYLGTLAATGGDTDAAESVRKDTEKAVTYEPKTDAGKGITKSVDDAVAPVANYVGDKVQAAADRADRLHGPAAGAFVKTALEGAPYVLGLGGELGAGRALVGGEKTAARVAEAAKPTETETSTDKPDLSAAQPASAETPAIAPKPAAGTVATAPLPGSPEAAPAPSLEAPTAEIAPAAPEITQHTVGAAADTPPKFEEAPPEEIGEPKPSAKLSDDERNDRVNTLRELGLDEVPESVISGDKKAASTDYAQSLLDNPGGDELSNVFTKMRKALDNYTNRLVTRAGGSSDLDGAALENRGSLITKPLQGLSDLYDANIKKLYQAADARAQGVPLDLNSTQQLLAKRSNFVGTTEGRQLLDGINTHLSENGLLNDAGGLNKTTVQQAELIKQYLNDQWSPRTARLIKGLKDAIDDDVTKSAGEDIYGQARAARRQRAVLLDDPKGIASLLDNSGPENINRAVPLEKIPDKLMNLPNEQFGHIISTLQKARAMPELADSATAALNEIRSHMMARMQQVAQKFKDETWNNRGVSQFLNANSAKLAKVFTPEELRQIGVLNKAGNILDVNRSYKGSAVQKHNLAARIGLGALQKGGALAGEVVGSALGAPGLGTLAGQSLGAKASAGLESSLSRKAARKRITSLTDE